MGGPIDRENLERLRSTKLEDVEKELVKTKEWLSGSPAAKDYPHVGLMFDMMANAATLAAEECRKKSAPTVGPEYYQAAQSLIQFRSQAEGFLKNPSDENLKPLVQSSGHFVDRISQKILQVSGQETLKASFASLVSQNENLRKLLLDLHRSAEALGVFAKTQSVSALHAQYADDKSSFTFGARVWLGLALLDVICFLIYISHGICVMPGFIESLNVPVDGANLYMLLSAGPRIVLSIALIAVAVACWRNYLTYKHLSTSARRKEIAAQLIPILSLDMPVAEKSRLKHEFLMKIIEEEESGFIIQSRQPVAVSMPKLEG